MEALCPGSGSKGLVNISFTENRKKYVYYRCAECGVFLPNSPLKEHLQIRRNDTRMSRQDDQ